MKRIVLLLVLFPLFSCSLFDEATFELSDGRVVTVDQRSFDGYQVGQKVWLYKRWTTMSEWETITDFEIEQNGFEPTKDTIFQFHSQNGVYFKEIALGTLKKLH